jgi:HEAT repeat protein
MGDASSREPLHRALSDPEGIVRSHAAAALVRIGGIEELPTLRSLVENDTDPTVRASTVRVLGEMHDERMVSLLITALHDESVMVRGEAADALGATGGARARAALETAARSDPDPGVRERAGAALRHIDPAHGRNETP